MTKITMTDTATTNHRPRRYKIREEQELTLKKHQKKDMLVYIPGRCEVCEAVEKETSSSGEKSLMKCGGCGMVLYCCKEHQKEDWPRHKKECKKLQRLGLWGCVYDQEEELERYPVGSQCQLKLTPKPNCPPPGYDSDEYYDSDDDDDDDDDDDKGRPRLTNEERKQKWDNWEKENNLIPGPEDMCGICGTKQNLERTDCCGMWICNNEENYVMMSYSRAFCNRSHRRYTLCGHHHNEGHDPNVDWRECEKCKTGMVDDGARSWYSTNGYNFTPGLFSAYPKGSFITAECTKCKGRLASGFEGHGFGQGGLTCMNCTGGPW